jgi:hypothetical protein
MLITDLNLVKRLRMSGVIPLFHLYAFVAWTGIILPFFKYIIVKTLLQRDVV